MKIKLTKWEIKPANALAAAIIYLILAWGFSYLIDIHNFLGFRELFFNEDMDVQLFWYYIFHDGFITEWLQWSFLGGTAMFCSYLGGRLISYGYNKPAMFWIIMGISTVLMFIEDAFNTRHYLASITQELLNAEGFTNPVKTMTYIIYFFILGAIPLYAVIRYWRYIWCETKTRFYICLGFISYALAVIASGTRDIFSWYSVVGEFLNGLVADGVMSAYFVQTEPTRPLGFYIMDSLVEESVELIAASALFASTIAYLQALNNSQEIGSSVYKGKFNILIKRMMKR